MEKMFFCWAVWLVSIRVWVSCSVFAKGFSIITCFPAFSAASAMGAWRLFGVQMSIMSISCLVIISSQFVLCSSHWYVWAAVLVFVGLFPTIICFFVGIVGRCVFMLCQAFECAFPMNSVPISAIFSGFFVLVVMCLVSFWQEI